MMVFLGRSLKVTAVFLGLGFLAACSAPPDPYASTTPLSPAIPEVAMMPASQADLNNSSVTLIRCLMARAAQLDDHTSDASVIAESINGSCMDQWNSLSELEARGKTDAEAQALLEAPQDVDEETQFSLAAVLLERKSEAKN